jgi:two-component system cell cycle response regulator DivK
MPGAPGPRVLVAEDNAVNFELIHDLLVAAGHSVTWARDGEQALAQLSRTRFDLFVMDLHLPRVPGQRVIEAIRADPRHRDVPVLVLSADALSATGPEVLALGATRYLTKPFELREFRETIAALLA